MDTSSAEDPLLFVGDAFDQKTIQRLTEHTVVVESTRTGALDQVHETDPSCVICEYHLRTGDGVELLRAIRDEFPSLPVVIWTDSGDERIASEAITAGVTDYLIRNTSTTQKKELDRVLSRVEELTGAEQPATEDRHPVGDSEVPHSDSREEGSIRVWPAIDMTGIALTDGSGQLIRANGRASEILGISEDEMGGRIFVNSAWEILDHDGNPIQEADLPVERVQVTGESIPPTVLGIKRGSEDTTWLHVTASPMDLSVNQTAGTAVLTIFSEITASVSERQSKLSRERRLRAIFEESFDAMVITDNNGDYVEANPAACDLFGLSREELLGRSIEEFAADGFDFDASWQEFQAAEQDRGTFPLVRADGEMRTVEYTATTDILPGYHLSILRDVTEKRRIEEELNEVFERIDHAVHGLDDEWRFTYLNERAEELLGRSEEELRGKYVWDEFPDALERSYRDRYERAMETQEPTVFEEYSDAAERWLEVHVYPSETGLSVYFQDINERKKREQKLEQYETVVETVDDGIYAVDEDARFVMVNDALCEMTGYQRAELLGSQAATVHDPDITPRVRRQAEEIEADDREVGIIELDLQAKDGTRIPSESRFKPFPLDEGIGRCGVVRDITDRKERERRLELFERMVETVNDGVYATDGDGDFIFVNDSFVSMSEHSRDELLGSYGAKFFGDRFVGTDENEWRELVDGERDAVEFETDIVGPDSGGRTVHNQFVNLQIDGEMGRVGVVRDITERKERQEELQLFRDVVDHSSDAIYVVDPETAEVIDVNDTSCRMVGYARSELLEMTVPDINPEISIQGWDEVAESVVEKEERVYESTHRRKDGSTFPVEIKVRRVSLDTDYMVSAVRDISERKARERKLKASEEKFRSLIEAAPDPIFVADAQTGEIVEANTAACRIRKQSRDELIGLHQSELHPDEEWYRDLFEKHVEQGGTFTHFKDNQVMLQTASDEKVPVSISAEKVDLGNREIIQGIFRDISALKRYQDALEELNRAAQTFFDAETDQQVANRMIDIAEEILAVPLAGIYFYDTDTGLLRPASYSMGLEQTVGEPPTLSPKSSIAWRAYASQERVVLDDVREDEDVYNPGTPIRSECIYPLGDHGVFFAASTELAAFDEVTVELSEILAATTKAALDQVDRARKLQEQRRESRLRAERLDRASQINDKIRSIIETVVRADSREEILEAVCDHLTSLERIAFAWAGEHDHASETMKPETWAGLSHEYLETLSLGIDEEGKEPAARAVLEKETVNVENVADTVQGESWRQTALLHDFRSVLSIPLLHDDLLYGALTIYATQPAAFDDQSVSVLTELGGLIGYAIETVEQQRAMRSTKRIDITLEISNPTDPMVRLADQLDSEFEVKNVTSRSDGSYCVQLIAHETDAERLRSLSADFISLDDVRVVGETEPALVEVILDEACIISVASEVGVGSPSIQLSGDGGRFTVSLPRERDVRSFIERLQERYPAVTLIGRQTSESADAASASFLHQQLTERQHEILKTAYFSGFFEQPRKSTGSDVANLLGISQPAFSKQLRKSEQQLLQPLYDPG